MCGCIKRKDEMIIYEPQQLHKELNRLAQLCGDAYLHTIKHSKSSNIIESATKAKDLLFDTFDKKKFWDKTIIKLDDELYFFLLDFLDEVIYIKKKSRHKLIRTYYDIIHTAVLYVIKADIDNKEDINKLVVV